MTNDHQYHASKVYDFRELEFMFIQSVDAVTKKLYVLKIFGQDSGKTVKEVRGGLISWWINIRPLFAFPSIKI